MVLDLGQRMEEPMAPPWEQQKEQQTGIRFVVDNTHQCFDW
jgi:hypothetical protein